MNFSDAVRCWSRLREAGLELGEPRLLYWSGKATAAGHASTWLLHYREEVPDRFGPP